MLKKPVKKIITKTPTNQPQIKQAYELVSQDLLTNLKKAKDGAIIKLGDLGAFHKKRTRVQNPYGDTYLYYRISFKISNQSKKELA